MSERDRLLLLRAVKQLCAWNEKYGAQRRARGVVRAGIEGVVHITPNKIKAGARAVKRPYKLTEADGTRNDLGRAIDAALALRKTACGSGNIFKLPAQSPLFLNNKGEAWTKSGFDSAWERCLEKAGIERGTFHFHDLRGKAGTDSATLAEAQQLLGHTDSKTTNRVYRRKEAPITPLGLPKGKRA